MKFQKYLFLFILFFTSPIYFPQCIIVNHKEDRAYSKNLSLSSISPFYFEWEKTWGKNTDERGEGIATDSYNNIYIVGYSTRKSSEETNKICLVKFNNISGEIEWFRVWDDGFDNYGYGITIDYFNNIYIVGSSHSSNYKIVIIKFDKFGFEIWHRYWENSSSGYAVATDLFSNVYVIGDTRGLGAGNQQNAVLIKYNTHGDFEWNRILYDSYFSFGLGKDIEIDLMGNIFIVGWISHSTKDILLAKYNTEGVQLWNKTIGSRFDDLGYGITLDLFGNIYLCGRTYNDAYHGNALLIKCNDLGEQLWNKTWGIDSNKIAYGIDADLLGYIYVTGWSDSYGDDYKSGMFLLKYNSSGDLEKEYIKVGFEAIGTDVLINGLEEIYLVGTLSPSWIKGKDMCLIKFGLKKTSENKIAGYNLILQFLILGLISLILYSTHRKIIRKIV